MTPIFKKQLMFALPIFLIILGLMLAVFEIDQSLREKTIIHNFKNDTKHIAEHIQNHLVGVNSDVLFLAAQKKALGTLCYQHEDKLSSGLSAEYLKFMELNPQYIQLRLIDLMGQEVVRVDRIQDQVIATPYEALQDKSGRYYFKEAEHITPGTVYQSLFDLNIEQGVIERPFKPTIRFLSPVVDELNKTVGFVALNLDASRLLNELEIFAKNSKGDVYWVNRNGYYFMSPDESQNWGFMFGKTAWSLASEFADVWRNLPNIDAQGDLLDNSVFYQLEVLNSQTPMSAEQFNYHQLPNQGADMPWYVVGRLNLNDLPDLVWWQHYWPLVFSALLALVLLFLLRLTSRLVTTVSELSRRESALVESQNAVMQSQTRFKELFEAVPVGLMIINQHGQVESSNQQIKQLLNLSLPSRPDEQLTNLVKELFKFALHQTLEDFFAAPKRVEVLRDNPFVCSCDGDIQKFFEVIIDPLSYGQEQLAIVVMRDVTSGLQIEDQLRQSQKMEAIGQLTGGIAHDFNNMLGIVMGNLELLKLNSEQDEKQLTRIDNMMTALKNAASLTQKLLGISRKKTLKIETIDVSLLMNEVLEMLHRTIKHRIQIHYQSGSDLPLIRVDASELLNALINLAVNAKDAMPDGGSIFIKTERVYLDEAYVNSIAESIPEGEYLKIEVEDTGSGIPPEIIDKVLEPFYTTKEIGKGTGLGLAMVYGFIKQSNGHMHIYSEVGKGTNIHIYLPVVEDGSLKTLSATPSTQSLIHLAGKKVLVVDDEIHLASILKDYLLLDGMECDLAFTGDQAWLNLTQKSYDLVISDIVMPGKIDGIKLAELILTLKHPMPVILCSGFSSDLLVKQHLMNGDILFIKKPYSRDIVQQTVLKAFKCLGANHAS
ncbi:ATP-binding protein [Thiosulfativibrio zosterae]|uniref:histidine kinase n=1 Tax=Thiosulfativibrio zosterae TaxID=2675053 RepID=A0A6F8PMX6_9GAMM|nr:ATP-binding protein [Thiosulfativibrio zosterae]BBP43459.1 hypothetical protein THMIRHAT_12050 [Thiosulfativibrio zosterae]